MANNATNYLETNIVKHALGVTSFTMPTSLYLALHTADPTEVGNVSEVTGGSYARQAIVFEFNTPAVENNGIVRFDDMPACTVTHFTIWDAVTSGNCLIYGSLTSSIVLGAGSSVELADNELSITVD